MTRWFRTVEILHVQLMLLQLDWKRSDPQNLPYFSQAALNLGLITSSGDETTGVPWARHRAQRTRRALRSQKRADENGQAALIPERTSDGGEIYRQAPLDLALQRA